MSFRDIMPDIRELGYVRVAAVLTKVVPTDVKLNVDEHVLQAFSADSQGADIVCYPELSLTGYTCMNLFTQAELVKNALDGLLLFCNRTKMLRQIFIVGLPWRDVCGRLLNVAAIVYRGKVLALIPKSYTPNYGEFQEDLWFLAALGLKFKNVDILGESVPLGTDILISVPDLNCVFGAEICEDGWMKIPPSCLGTANGAQLYFNLSASPEKVGTAEYRRDFVVNPQAARCVCGYVYASAGRTESTSSVVFGGHRLISENGTLIAEALPLTEKSGILVNDIDMVKLENERSGSNTNSSGDKYWASQFPFRTVVFPQNSYVCVGTNRRSMLRKINPMPFVPKDPAILTQRCRQILDIMTTGLEQRLLAVYKATSTKRVIVNLSGGRDSILAFLVTLRAFDNLEWDRKDILVTTLPGPGTSKETHEIAVSLPAAAGTSFLETEIEDIATLALRKVGHEPCWKCLTCENAQARARTFIGMTAGFLLGTGNMTEAFNGWCTFAGDQISMYNPNSGAPKTLVSFLIRQCAEDNLFGDAISADLRKALTLIISPELIKTEGEAVQATEDFIGPPDLNDYFMFAIIRNKFSPFKVFWEGCLAFEGKYEPLFIMHWLEDKYKKFFGSQFKRDSMPNGVKSGSVSLSQFSDWRMASDLSMPSWWAEQLSSIKLKLVIDSEKERRKAEGEAP